LAICRLRDIPRLAASSALRRGQPHRLGNRRAELTSGRSQGRIVSSGGAVGR
jgi:hypothetical protein